MPRTAAPRAAEEGPSVRPARPLRVAIVNDYEVIVAGVGATLAPFGDRVEVVEGDVDKDPEHVVDVALLIPMADRAWVLMQSAPSAQTHESARWLSIPGP